MKLTRHNGRSGKHGTYNPRHNDRRFDVENSEHIDAERARQNVYWDCYRGFTTHDFRENPEQPDFSFEEIERMYYYEHYADHVNAQNARNEKTRHIERNRTVDDLLKNNKTCPEESIYQIGTMEESVPPETLALIVSEFYEEFENRFGSHIHILDWALHLDEGTPHIHERHVFDCENRYGELCPHGIIYCATCGKSMQVRYEKVGRTGKNRFTGEQREPIDKAYYICQTYNRLGKNACTSHKIEARDLYNLVLKDIQELAKTALKDADAFYQRLSSRMERRYLLDASQTQKECQRLESRNCEIDEMFLSLYTDKAKGILTEQRFMKLTATLEQEQEANQKRLRDLLLMMRHSDEQENEVRTFIKEIRRYAAIEELDEAVLNRLISKILVGEVKKIDGQKVQEVRIVYNFVGEIPEITA